jgi:hypothetical protein
LLLRWHLLGSGHLWPAITKDHLCASKEGRGGS